MIHTSVLHKLQSIDSESDARRARLEEINVLLGANEEVRAASETLQAADERLQATRAQANQLELEIGDLEDKAKASTDRLYGGAVTNPKELQDLEHELEALGRRRDTLEESLLEKLVVADDEGERVAAARSELERIEEAWTAGQGDLAEEKRELEARLAELDTQRVEVASGVDADTLKTYEDLRARLGGRALATIEGGVCTACGVQPSSSVTQKARHGQPDALCPSCGRILYDMG